MISPHDAGMNPDSVDRVRGLVSEHEVSPSPSGESNGCEKRRPLGYAFNGGAVCVKVRFSLVSGPPHNVVFWADSIPKAAAALAKGRPGTVDKLTSPFFLKTGDSYVVSFAGAPAGRYVYNCAPHLALGMKAVIDVK